MLPALQPQAFPEQKGFFFASIASLLRIRHMVGLIQSHASGPWFSLCKEHHFCISDMKGSSQKSAFFFFFK